MKPFTFLIVLLLAGARVAQSQQPAAPAPGPASPQPPAADAPPVPAPSYSYEPESRRDPFVSLVHGGTDGRKTTVKGMRPDGIGGVMVDEVAVRGIVQSRGNWVAMIAAPNGRSYTIHPGDRLMDGSVRAITAQAVVMMQEVNSPLSLEKQREVRKQLRGEVK